MRFGFMPGRGTTNALFVVTRMHEKHRFKEIKLFMCFVNIEKAFDGVPREIIEWAMRKINQKKLKNFWCELVYIINLCCRSCFSQLW